MKTTIQVKLNTTLFSSDRFNKNNNIIDIALSHREKNCLVFVTVLTYYYNYNYGYYSISINNYMYSSINQYI